MKKFKNLIPLKNMNPQTNLKNILKLSLGLSCLLPILKVEDIKAVTACATSDSVSDLSAEANPCFITPEMMKVKFYEIGFCTEDPLSTGTFVNTNCYKTWDNSSGFTTDIGQQTFENMVGEVYRIPNGTYTHAYAIMTNEKIYKAKYKLSDGNTYYTNSTNGLVTTNESEYGEWTDDISNMVGEETTDKCFDYTASTDEGTVTAILTNESLVTATDTSTCESATRVIGSIALNSSVKIDNNVRGYKLNWKITNQGIGISDGGNADNIPYDWAGGPFTPIFTLIK